MKRERVLDWKGGKLQIVRVLEAPTGDPFLYEDVDVVECVPLAHGLALPVGLKAPVEIDGEAVAEIEIGAVAGRPACIAIRALPGHALSLVLLHKLPALGRLVQAKAAPAVVRVVRAGRRTVGERYIDASEFTGLDTPRQKLADDIDAGRRSITADFLREVAVVYREARAAGESTTAAITAKWPTTETNARRWVALARKRGYLGSAPDRRGGEVPLNLRGKRPRRTKKEEA